jgi:hypothetical protein
MRIGIPVTAACLVAVVAFPAVATAPLKVYSPVVEYRELEIEWRGAYDFDTRPDRDGTHTHKIGVGYGVLPRVFVESYAELEKTRGGEAEVEEVEVEGKIQLTEAGQYWLDAGLLVEYAAALEDGQNDDAAISALLQKQTGSFLHIANVIVGRTIASGADVETGLGWSTRYRAGPRFEPGVEYFAAFGPIGGGTPFDRQAHYAGPVAYGRLGSLRYDVGYLFGLSEEASDGVLKWNLEYEIRF